MSLITRCPACGTMFKVVPDQLRISEGWVRCGHCAEVFDAQAHLMGPEAAAEPAAEEDEAIPPPPPLEQDTQPSEAIPLDDAPDPGALPPPMPAALPQPAVTASELHESELDQPFVFRRSDLVPEQDSRGESLPFEESAPPPPASKPAPLAEHDQEIEDVTFLRQARRRAFWRRPGVRVAFGLLAVVLAVLLAGQVAVAERDLIAATNPELKPWLARLCDVAGCTIRPARQIETLAIDSSSFNRLRSDTYRLSFTLKNNSPMPVAVPSMELTLTDGQDQPVLRRVLAPEELGAASPVMTAGADWSTSIAIAVTAAAQANRVAGYRLLAFYP